MSFQRTHSTFSKNYSTEAHLLSLPQLSNIYNSKIDLINPINSKGLTEEEAKISLEVNGENILSPPKQIPEWKKFLKHVLDLFNLLLGMASILSFTTFLIIDEMPDLILAIFLLCIIIFDSLIGYFQERSSSNVMKKFKSMLPPRCIVVRNGKEKEIAASGLVVGDLVKVKGGDKIPADLRVIHCRGLKVEQSALNGESEAVEISEESMDKDFLYSRCVIFNGCLCMEGSALGIVLKTGDETYLGIIAQQTAQIQQGSTPLQQEIKEFVKFNSILGICLGLLTLLIGIIRGADLMHIFVHGFLIVIIANIPQGLPATVVSCLNIIAHRMASKNVYIKNLESIETLGSATVIATDKTGTLTMNEMTVENIWCDGQIESFDFMNVNIDFVIKSKAWRKMIKIAAICNKAILQRKEQGISLQINPQETSLKENDYLEFVTPNFANQNFKMENLQKSNQVLAKQKKDKLLEERKSLQKISINDLVGEPLEKALLFFSHCFRDFEALRQRNEKVYELPFNSVNKFQFSVHKKKNGNIFGVIKGAPEIILKKSGSYLKNGESHNMDQSFKDEFNKTYEFFGSKGERVIGCAFFEFQAGFKVEELKKMGASLTFEFCFLGLYSLLDPPKPGVADAIFKARLAGIKVFMITGDHPLTAEAIAKKTGIITETRQNKENIITGVELERFTNEQWDQALSQKELVFARISPQQKVEIVENLQRLDEIVIVTGDGVNDAIALKRANIGVAMGLKGTDVAKEAAEVVFMDDKFESIINGIEEGRTLFDNLKKTIAYTLTHCPLELTPILLHLLFDIPLGFTSVQMLVVDLGTELAPAITLAYQPSESSIMTRPPRNRKKDRLVSVPLLVYSYLLAGSIEVIGCLICYFSIFLYYGIMPNELFWLNPIAFNEGGKSNQRWFNDDGQVFELERQEEILKIVQTAWLTTAVMGQFVNVWMCSTRQSSIFFSAFKNDLLKLGVLIELAIILLVDYAPFLQKIFGTHALVGLWWTPWLWSLFVLLAGSEARKAWTRRFPEGKVAKLLLW